MLIVESDPASRLSITSWFDAAGYTIAPTRPRLPMLRAFELSSPDIVLVDQTVGGLAFIKVIRDCSDVPIMAIASTTDSEESRIRTLELGADDIVMPGKEMLARARALLRRVARGMPYSNTLQIDLDSHQVRKGNQVIELPHREFELLAHLAASPHKVFKHAELLQDLWGLPLDAARLVTITEYVYRIRRKIEDDPAHPCHLVTVRGAGYRFEP